MFDGILGAADHTISPWVANRYVPEMDLLRELLSLPISTGEKQESGRVAKALDAWVAHELRRSGFPADGVWPRTKRPRVLPEDAAPLEHRLATLAEALVDAESTGGRVKPAALTSSTRTAPTRSSTTSSSGFVGPARRSTRRCC